MAVTSALHFLFWSSTAVAGVADREESVAAGRDVLDRWIWKYPWYDAQTDGVRPIEVSEPWHVRWEWLLDWLGNLFSFSWSGGGSWSWLKVLAWVGIAALFVLLVYLMVRGYRRRLRGGRAADADAEPADADDDRRRVEALPPGARRKSDLLSEATRQYEQGNYSEAVVYLFSYQLVHLDKNQLIRLARGKTNRQYLRELGRRLALRQMLARTMVAFEEVFFGHYTLDRARFESVWLGLERFEALAAEEAA